MEKFEKYNPDEETIEAWLKSFEIQLLCHNITAADCKSNWCRSLVGEAGNRIIEKLPQAATWPEIKEELCSVLGENDPREEPLRTSLAISLKVKTWGKWPLILWPKLLLPPMIPTYRRSLGSKYFSRLCPETLARSCVAYILIRSRKPSRRRASFSLLKKTKTVEVGKFSQLKQNHLIRVLRWKLSKLLKPV